MAQQKPANRVFEEYMRSLEPEKEKNNKLSVAGAEELEQENAATTEELSAMIKSIGSETVNTEITTDISEENIQTTLQEEQNAEYIRKSNEERFLAEQEAKKKIEEEQRRAEEATEAEKRKKKGFPFPFKKKKDPQIEETPIDIEVIDSGEPKDVTPKQTDKFGVPIQKKEKNFFAKAFAKPTKLEDKIPEIKSAEDAITQADQDWQFIATHDEATGFYNKKAFDLRGGETIPSLGVILMDINNLKYTNERFGRDVGDVLINRMSDRLKDAFQDDEIYRIDGDEFIVLILNQDPSMLPVILDSRIEQLRFDFQKMTEKGDGVIYSATFGKCIAADNETVRSAAKKAAAEMQKEKKEYHDTHPEFSMDDERIPERTEEEKKENIISKEDYDAALLPDQRELKNMVAEYHEVPSVSKVEKIVEEINEKALAEGTRIKAIIMTSADFNDAFVFQNVHTFLGMVDSVGNNMDFSYLYIITKDGTQYCGPDRYSDDVDSLFKGIGNAIRSGTVRTKQELSDIDAMSIFQNHYSDFND